MAGGGGKGGRDRRGELAASPGPELSPLEPGPSPLAASEGAAAPGRSCFLYSLGVFPAGRVGGLGRAAGEEDIKGAKLSGGRKGAAGSATPDESTRPI